MKKLFILLILGFSVPALAEIVSTVSFNPSRIGTYKYLKVSRDANFKGGLETPTLNVQSAGEVTMRWDNANTTEKYYNVPTITGTTGPVSVDMPSTTFLQDTTLSTSAISYSAANATDPGNKIDTITMTGGSLSFDGTTNNDSYVTKMKGNGTEERAPVQFYTTALSENTLNINGNSGSSVGLTDENGSVLDNAQTLGFHLAGVDIPHPKLHTVNKTTSGTKENASLSLTGSGCGLAWVKRTAEVTENGKTANKNVYVLAFDGCSAEGGTTEPENQYYFKCVSRTQSNGLLAMGAYSSLSEAEAACLSGRDTSAEYYKYLSGGGEDPNCRAPEGQSCPMLPTYYIKYQCSTEPPKAASGYGFDEITCMLIIPHE